VTQYKNVIKDLAFTSKVSAKVTIHQWFMISGAIFSNLKISSRYRMTTHNLNVCPQIPSKWDLSFGGTSKKIPTAIFLLHLPIKLHRGEVSTKLFRGKRRRKLVGKMRLIKL